MPHPAEVAYLDRAPDDLDAEIGRALLAGQLGAKPVSDAVARATAARWFDANLDRFRDAVCTHPFVVTQVLDASQAQRNELFAAILDALGSMAGIKVPVAVLSARLVHYGVGRLCGVPPPAEVK